MRLRALLLSLFVLFLSVKPMAELAFFKLEVDECCKNTKEKNVNNRNQPEQEEGCDDFCTPFKPCCPYITFSPAASALILPKTTYLGEMNFADYHRAFITGYTSDFWQPPKIV